MTMISFLPARRIGGPRGQVEAEGETSYVVQVISFFNPSWSRQVQGKL